MAAVTLLMATWWLTEAIPSAVTALLPLILLPSLGILPLTDVSKLYMHKEILMTLGGFLISLAVEESGLVKRLALKIVSLTGDSPRKIVLGFLIATFGISMWVSNAAAAIMMLPVGLSILSEIEETPPASAARKNLGIALMLGIAYGATIGGTSTAVGTLSTQSFLTSYGGSLNITPLG
jgi:sodium-dependent dicarboxylate transporter 2/3/5